MCGIVAALRSGLCDKNLVPLAGDGQRKGIYEWPIAPKDRKAPFAAKLAEQGSVLSPDDVWQWLCEGVAPRGPDFSGYVQRRIQVKQFNFELRMHASVLHMRGDTVTKQPFFHNDDILIYNGEVFDGLQVGQHENDGKKLFETIQKHGPASFFAAIKEIEGPYAFVYYQATSKALFYARDPLGRRSLLIHEPTAINPYLIFASAAPQPLPGMPLNDWVEVSPDAVHAYRMADLLGESWESDKKRGMVSYPRHAKSAAAHMIDILAYPFDPIEKRLPRPEELLQSDPLSLMPRISNTFETAVAKFHEQLSLAVQKRVQCLPFVTVKNSGESRIAVLFSGGLDCATLALLADAHVDPNEPIDLLNVAFENPRSIEAAQRTSSNGSTNGHTNGHANGNSKKNKKQYTGLDVLLQAVEKQDNGNATSSSSSTSSGSPHTPASPPASPDVYLTPDRVTGLATYEELRRLRPHRRWRFVSVDIPYWEFLQEKKVIMGLMRPSNTVMDLSIAQALYFASRGKGTVRDPHTGDIYPYQSHAKVLLSGLGADEQLAGYSRHRKAFARSKAGDWEALIKELQLDLDRIGTRNLGRDDRIISNWGKEVRYPFLAGHVVAHLASLPVHLKCDLRFPEGTGDKLLLRVLAHQLGLQNASMLKKRAIQFGARSAKMELSSGKATGADMLL